GERRIATFRCDCRGVILHKDVRGRHVGAYYDLCWDTARSTSGCVFTYSKVAVT
ncbi:hypothetical protein WALSEDRAFT_58970, partial [Wallemia mellicola CBS 633.66]